MGDVRGQNRSLVVAQILNFFLNPNLETCGTSCFSSKAALLKLHWQPTRLEKKKGIDYTLLHISDTESSLGWVEQAVRFPNGR